MKDKVIKDNPTFVIDDVGQEYDPTQGMPVEVAYGNANGDDDVVGYMENKYPEMTQEFLKIQREQYELFLHKQHDYGPQNIAVGQELKNEEEKRLSLMGIWFRINDKVERIKTLIMRGDNGSLENEGLVDSYSDISNYGVMAQVVSRGKWAK
jgi:hypothetical protein